MKGVRDELEIEKKKKKVKEKFSKEFFEYHEPKKKKKKEKKKKEVSEKGMSFAKWFKSLLPEKTRTNTNDLRNWAECYDEMITKDKRTPKEISEICKWAREDRIWEAHFMSPLKLRKRNNDKVLYYEVFKNGLKLSRQKPNMS